jgi:hypothetical protein
MRAFLAYPSFLVATLLSRDVNGPALQSRSFLANQLASPVSSELFISSPSRARMSLGGIGLAKISKS